MSRGEKKVCWEVREAELKGTWKVRGRRSEIVRLLMGDGRGRWEHDKSSG